MDQIRGKNLFLTMQHVIQIVLSVYGLRHSYVAITNLQKYEDATKKLAEWSQEAQDQLNKTRTTQGSGAVAVGSLFEDMVG
jgi:aspartate/tyrosine/aromatic aminotransferase